MKNKNIYFISDAHLGTPDSESSLLREKKLVSLLDSIKDNAEATYFLGDIFDFWYEYKRVVPRGFTRFLGKVATLSDSGIEIHFFTGNHDIWVKDYLPDEIGLIIHRHPVITEIMGKTFYLAHGDGLDETDRKFRILKRIFTNRVLQWCFSRLHPNLAIGLAGIWSRHSRIKHGTDAFKGEDEPVVKYARKNLTDLGLDYLVMGHRHCPVVYQLTDHTKFIILGDWLSLFTYGVFDGTDFKLESYK